MKAIVTIPNPALRKKSVAVEKKELGNSEFKELLLDLSSALKTRDDGVGLSAPQIAVNKRVFVVSGKVFDKDYMSGKNKTSIKNLDDQYFINPEITKASKKLSVAEEGCLSIPETYGMVKRPNSVSMKYLTVDGEEKETRATGLLARIFQHEIDHLDGILFTDKATNIKKGADNHENTEY